MVAIKKTAIVSFAFFAVVMAPAGASAQASLADRVTAAVREVQSACAADVNKFCSNVTRGEGRLLLCLQAVDDQLSHSCEFALYRASRNLNRALDRVERIADACWSDIEAQCSNADHIGKCVMEKSSSFSPSCQSVVSGIRQIGQGLSGQGSTGQGSETPRLR
jgi:Cysteine rich repeat